MALPVAHFALASGMTFQYHWRIVAAGCLISVLPDFDFALVWGLGLPLREWHRTWSHSLLFAAAVSLLWPFLRPESLQNLTAPLFLAVLSSHGLLDLLCTADTFEHGVMLFWPLSSERYGWEVLVPLYRALAPDPFSGTAVFLFSLLELALAPFLFLSGRFLMGSFRKNR